MRHLSTALMFGLLSSTALAWVPKVDEATAKTVIDTAYDRLVTPISTLLTLDLSVKDGKFAAGDVVRAFDGGDACVQNWLAAPTDFTATSRPTALTLTGQADEIFLAAQAARDEFKNLAPKEALARQGRLPDGQLRVYVAMQGLAAEKQRDAYTVVIRGGDGKPVRPVRRAFVSDWAQSGGRFSGTMVYYFDALKAGVNPQGKLDVLIRTEADTNCAYQITADLSKMY